MRRCFATVNRKYLSEIQKEIENGEFKYPAKLKQPDYMCFMAYMRTALLALTKHYDDVTMVTFYVDEKKHVSHYYKKFREEFRAFLENSPHPEVASLVGEVIPVSMQFHMPLQAADCLLWHIQRAYAHTEEPEDKKNLELLEEGSGGGMEWNKIQLEGFANAFKK